jgi:hypothetical protein
VLADSILGFKEAAALKRFAASVSPAIEAKTPPRSLRICFAFCSNRTAAEASCRSSRR